MNLRKLLIIGGPVVGFLLVAAIAIPFFIDTEQFRPMVEKEASTALGRQVKVGKLDLSLLSGAVVAHEITIADDPAFSRNPFVSAKALKIGVEMWPLITSREVHVTSVTLDEPQIQLVHAASGKWNFDSLGSGAKSKAKSQKQSGESLPGTLSVKSLKVKDGEITVLQGGKKHNYQSVNAEVRDFSPTSTFPFIVTAKTPGGGSLKLDGQAGPLSAGDTTQTPFRGEVTVKGLDLAATGFVAPESGISGVVDYNGIVKSDGHNLHSEGKAVANKLQLVKGGAPAREPLAVDYASDLDVVRRSGTLTRGDVLFGNGRAKLTGNFQSRGDALIMDARLRGDAMPMDSIAGILPAFGVVLPSGSQLQGGTVNTDLQLQGPLDRLVTSGPIVVNNARVTGFNLKSHASALSALAGLNASDLLIQLLNSNIRVAPEGIRADGIQLVVPSLGTVTGDGLIGPNSSLNFKMHAKLQNAGLMSGLSAISSLGQTRGELPFLIHGTTSNPIFLPDVQGAMANSIKAPAQDAEGLGGILGGLFGKKKK